MAVKIRLKRLGKIRAPHYRVVVADSRTKRDGKAIEEIGKYHPKENPSFIEVNSERAQYWLSVGAQPSEPVLAILKKTGDWQRFHGEPVPTKPLLQPAEKSDKRAKFDEALRAAHAEPDSAAVTQKNRRRGKSEPDSSSQKSAAAEETASADGAEAGAAGEAATSNGEA